MADSGLHIRNGQPAADACICQYNACGYAPACIRTLSFWCLRGYVVRLTLRSNLLRTINGVRLDCHADQYDALVKVPRVLLCSMIPLLKHHTRQADCQLKERLAPGIRKSELKYDLFKDRLHLQGLCHLMLACIFKATENIHYWDPQARIEGVHSAISDYQAMIPADFECFQMACLKIVIASLSESSHALQVACGSYIQLLCKMKAIKSMKAAQQHTVLMECAS